MGKSGPEPDTDPYKIEGRRRVGGLTKKTASPVRGIFLLICVFLFVFLFMSCGIEDYPYLLPVPQGNISQSFNSQATILIDNTANTDPNSPFYNYAIYYRIYVGTRDESSPSPGNFSAINPTLAQDYSAIAAYINSTTMGNTSMGSLFQNRNYNALEISTGSLDSLLASEDRVVVIEFPQNQGQLPQPWPYLTISVNSTGTLLGSYYLYRSTGNNRFTPKPDRYFMNSADLIDPSNINSNINADVVNTSSSETPRHAYAAFFIVAVGLDTTTFSSIYSTPAFVGVLRLPDVSP
jgi:hypothetical protein